MNLCLVPKWRYSRKAGFPPLPRAVRAKEKARGRKKRNAPRNELLNKTAHRGKPSKRGEADTEQEN